MVFHPPIRFTDSQRRTLRELCACEPGIGHPNHVFNRSTVDALVRRGFVEKRPMKTINGGWFKSGDYVAVATDKGRAAIAETF